MNAQQLSDLLLKLEKIKGVISVKRPSEKIEK
jgi:hypothetical protein